MKKLSEKRLKDMYEEYKQLCVKNNINSPPIDYKSFKSVYRWA